MKKLIPVILVILALSGCKKTEFSPVGPTDVRIRNLSDQTLNELTVKFKSQSHLYGSLGPSQVSDYFRYDTAFVKAEITARINDILFSTSSVNYLGLIHIGRERITLDVWLPSGVSAPVIEIDDVVYDEPLVLED
jgi:hypothetical protein